ncbi:hypothetical protein FOE78_01510 [Microlunatus elymi]|uniref:DUF4352 domain-containing protein n=1 Tax=Microlunatus elymi TaxID=2596828 RepID=A0A516PUB1_9ACTN|nr:hypothetical protein [Microlunatus elymi]QDP94767.1 hypothetical protein FOE78_01510 [Microlunatus elymi]
MITSNRLSDRARSWIVAMIAFCCVLIFLVVWTTYATTHTKDRFEQLPAGATGTLAESTFRVLELKQTEVMTDGEDQHPSDANEVWVVATMDLTLSHPVRNPTCTLELVAEGNRTWEPVTTEFFDRSLPQYCGGDTDEHPIKVGQPWRFEQVFRVPTRFVDHIYGVALVDHGTAAPMKVLRPA